MRVRLALALLLVVFAREIAWAQPAGDNTEEILAASELRIGAITGLEHDGGPPSAGGGLRFRPWTHMPRLGIYAAADYRRLGATTSFDEALNSRVRLVRSALTVAGSLAFDVVSTRRAAIDVRAGIAFFRATTGFQIASENGFVDDDKDWEGVCGFSGFRSRCSNDYAAAGAVSAGLRILVKNNGAFYVGADYTRLTNGANLAMAVIGVRTK
jgi:hypothetical protein